MKYNSDAKWTYQGPINMPLVSVLSDITKRVGLDDFGSFFMPQTITPLIVVL